MNLLQQKPNAILAIDSSTQLASVALSVAGRMISFEECVRQKSHSEWINGALDRALKNWGTGTWNEIDLIAVTHGPGSFTGVRVASNLVKSLAYSLNKPIVSFSSLEILAAQSEVFESSHFSQPTQPQDSLNNANPVVNDSLLILPMINAFKNMVFMSLFRASAGSLVQILEDQAIEIDKLESFLLSQNYMMPNAKIQIIGDGFEVYKSYIASQDKSWWTRSPSSNDYPLASTIINRVHEYWSELPVLGWRELTPTYIRASAAEEQYSLKNS